MFKSPRFNDYGAVQFQIVKHTTLKVRNIPQDAINEVYVFAIKYRYSDILLKKHKLYLFC